jgi:hypothetical protein
MGGLRWLLDILKVTPVNFFDEIKCVFESSLFSATKSDIEHGDIQDTYFFDTG